MSFTKQITLAALIAAASFGLQCGSKKVEIPEQIKIPYNKAELQDVASNPSKQMLNYLTIDGVIKGVEFKAETQTGPNSETVYACELCVLLESEDKTLFCYNNQNIPFNDDVLKMKEFEMKLKNMTGKRVEMDGRVEAQGFNIHQIRDNASCLYEQINPNANLEKLVGYMTAKEVYGATNDQYGLTKITLTDNLGTNQLVLVNGAIDKDLFEKKVEIIAERNKFTGRFYNAIQIEEYKEPVAAQVKQAVDQVKETVQKVAEDVNQMAKDAGKAVNEIKDSASQIVK